MNKVFVKINGVQHYLWRAVDHKGEVPEFIFSGIEIRRLPWSLSKNYERKRVN
ncbi:DDE-type integrase/transposase/recombinase [Bartonella sp. M0177]|uniref:DDE-type integrase/transposase/recombinase n=1 Tax=Bartonella sp. M0177 TaxID=2750940 RepID=UPI0035A92858